MGARALRTANPPSVVDRVPASAALVSTIGLVVAAVASLMWPETLRELSPLVWLLAVIPFLLLAHFKAWQGTARMLAAAMSILACAQLVIVVIPGRAPLDPHLVGLFVLTLVSLSFGWGLISQTRLHQQASTLYLAASDPLTGLPNPDALDFFLARCFAAAARGRPLSVVLFDLDQLGRYIERHGQKAGDEAICGVADILDANTRGMDMSGRYDRDQFLCLLPGGTGSDAFTFAVRVRKAVESSAAFRGKELTVSAGVASYAPTMAEARDLVQEATAVLYAAKEAGRNRVMRSRKPDDAVWEGERKPVADVEHPPEVGPRSREL